MPQKKGKKENKKVIKKVVVSKNQPLLKNSINIKIDLDDDNDKKKKTKRKKRQQKQENETTNNDAVSYVDEVGKPISNELINRSFTGSYMPQPFGRNSTVIGTSFNESAIMDRVMDKISRLNNTSNMTLNQSTNNTSLNQSVATPPRPAPRLAPPQLLRPAARVLPKQLQRPAPSSAAIQLSTPPMQFFNEGPPQLPRQPAPSTIAPASPSVAPQSLNFNLSSPVRPLGSIPMSASNMAMNAVQQYALSSLRAAVTIQEQEKALFLGVDADEEKEIRRTAELVKSGNNTNLLAIPNGGGRKNSFMKLFKDKYNGTMFYKDAGEIGYGFYNLHL